jgi:ribosomal protein S18 acetylase RimI-like enzyme
VRHLLSDAAARGATDAYLQIAEDNAAALALYGALGFTIHHHYCYLAAP